MVKVFLTFTFCVFVWLNFYFQAYNEDHDSRENWTTLIRFFVSVEFVMDDSNFFPPLITHSAITKIRSKSDLKNFEQHMHGNILEKVL